ncbi:LSM domain containing protein [Cryptosporidium tyzzeri]|nr:LSM domain containing protein [Cryptosporidium tyzzeri]
MSGLVAVNPKPFLSSLINKVAIVCLKWGNMRYKGTLVSFDEYMNILLNDCEEWIDNTKKGTLGKVFIRCNNVLYISRAEESKEVKTDIQKDEEMAE